MIFKRIRPPIEIIAPLIEEEINSGKDVQIGVTGNSMYPLLRSETDKVVLSKPENLKNLDVVFYKRANGQYVLHRIIRRRGDALFIAGDNETELEYPIYVSDCIGKMTSFIRRGITYSVNKPTYILYTYFWRLIFPLRHIAVKIIKLFSRCHRKLISGR